MKAIVGISTRMILILLSLIYIAGCFDESSDSGNSSDGGDIYSDASGYAIIDTGQIVCYDDSDELVTVLMQGNRFIVRIANTMVISPATPTTAMARLPTRSPA